MPDNGRKALGLAVVASCALAASRVSPLPPFQDAGAGRLLPELESRLPWSHLVLTPFSVAADWLTCQSARQHMAFWGWAAALYLLARLLSGPSSPRREAKALTGTLGALLVFLAWACFMPRAGSAPAPASPDVALLDFHSHSTASWDGRKGFGPAESARWHRLKGFDAFFLTDHNTRAGLDACRGAGAAVCLGGRELSAHDAHILELGPAQADEAKRHQGLAGLESLLGEGRAARGPILAASLPEYWKHHWTRLEELAGWGLRGLEIVSGAPKALDFPEGLRREAVELCRRKGLFVCGGTDDHGWSGTACVWNALTVPGWRGLDAGGLDAAVGAILRRASFETVQVIVRTRRAPRPGAAIWLDPPLGLWTALRTLSDAQRLAFLAWIWIPLALARWPRSLDLGRSRTLDTAG